MSSAATKLEVPYKVKKVYKYIKGKTGAKETFASWKNRKIWKFKCTLMQIWWFHYMFGFI